MSTLETFGWCPWFVKDSRDQLAFLELAPCVSKFSARKLRKMVRKIGSDQVHEETGIRWPAIAATMTVPGK